MRFQSANRQFTQFGISTLLAAALVACGGGGGSVPATNIAPSTTPTQPIIDASTLVTSVPTATYSGEAAAAFSLLNAERSRCGFGLLAQSTTLDAMSMAHANYMKLNGVASHTEVQGLPGFTGVNPQDRAIGYSGTVSEVLASGSGLDAIHTLLSAPYHLNVLFGGYRDIGVASLDSNVPGVPYFGANPGYLTAAGKQEMAGNVVATYPCDGTSGVNYQLRGESPNPVPGRDLAANPIGTPVLFRAHSGNALFITSVSMVKTSTGAPIVLRPVISASNDPNGFGYFTTSTAYVAPDAPLERLTQYTVTFSGTNNGTVFTNRTFSFTTGNGMN